MPERRTLESVLVLRRFHEKFRVKNKKCFIFLDLEKTLYKVPSEVICSALRWKGVPFDGELWSAFSLKVCVHQGSALSPLLFIMVVDVLTEDLRDCSLMELLDAKDLVLCWESLNEVMGKCGRWKNAVVWKKVNVNKQNVCSYYLVRKVVFWKWILVVSVVSRSVVILFSA